MSVTLDGQSLTIEEAAIVAERGTKVRVSAASLKRMDRFRTMLEQRLARGEIVYGVNTGFGSLSSKAVRLSNLRELQLNLVRSHANGVGDPMPPEVVRAAMLIRLNGLLKGNSAARNEVALTLLEMLNKGVLPFVPEFGSLGASGDLVPSAHMALTMVGEGSAYYKEKLMESRRALSLSKVKPLTLQAKEGLALINGTCFTTGLACVAVKRGRALLEAANSSVAVACEALGACSQWFDERLIRMKADEGQEYVARRLGAFLKDSQRLRTEPVPQDPYSLRCVPQVHGSLKLALDFSERIVVGEMNSVSDNPVLTDDGTALHGGNFHAQPVAMALDLIAIALSYIGVISLSRTNLLLSNTPTETKYMAGKPGLESGLMILQYTATALTADNAKQIYPQSAYPANVSGGTEDHASHGVNAGMKALAVARNVSRILAIELICASNVLGQEEIGISEHTKEVCRVVRETSPLLKGDRSQAEEIERLSKVVQSGGVP